MLLLVVCATLLAAPAIVMALITDLGRNTSPTIQSEKADIANPSANTLPAQTIHSKEADHTPGATVTLTGSNWQPGEYVHINVNDDQGKTWSRNADVRADASGQIQAQLQLPEWFVGTYKVTAMGAQSGVATTSFNEGNISFGSTSPAPASWSVNIGRMAVGTLPTTLLAPRGALADPRPSPPIPRTQLPWVSPIKSL